MFKLSSTFSIAVVVTVCVAAIAATPAASAATWKPVGPAPQDHVAHFVVAVTQKNHHLVDSLVKTLTYPDSPSRGNWLSFDQVGDLTRDDASVAKVLSLLKTMKQTAIQVSPNGDFISVRAPVAEAERALKARFMKYKHPFREEHVVRSESHEVPEGADLIFNVSDFPEINKPRILGVGARGAAGKVTPDFLTRYYNYSQAGPIPTNLPAGFEETLNVGIFESGQSFMPRDLAQFQNQYNLLPRPVEQVIGANDPSQCAADPDNCMEASLDIQYVAAVAQRSNITFWSIDPSDRTGFLDWVLAVSRDAQAPYIHSISYGSVENDLDPNVIKRFDHELAKLVLRGFTVVVSSGDDGVANFPARQGASNCGFFPSYPASSPHVTAVGATMGPESGADETACLSNKQGRITTGGGFSNVFDQPEYQKEAVAAYLKSAASLPDQTAFGTGRGYPDVSILGHNYEIIVNGQTEVVSGTSASAPVLAAMVALTHEARAASGRYSPITALVGFLNPAFYYRDDSSKPLTRYIDSGENNCVAGATVCCPQGFTAARKDGSSGWNPVVGNGALNFQNFFDYYTKQLF